MTEANLILQRPIGLLAEPALGAEVRCLLFAGDHLLAGARSQGFVAVETKAGQQGYLPEALCATATNSDLFSEPAEVKVSQAVALYSSPTPGAQFGARWLVQPGEMLKLLATIGMFVQIQRPNGQVGYVPTVLWRLNRAPPGQPAVGQVLQTVALYSSPAPGGQYEARWQLDQGEQLLELGRAERFVFVQRENGELGFIPAALCGQPIPEAILPVRPIDLGWIVIGGGWGLINWGGLALALYQLPWIEPALKPYLGLAIVLGVAAALWFGSRRPQLARSFAIGVLLAYAMLHFNSGGVFTLWS